MVGFVYALKDAGIPVSVRYALELYRGLKQGLARDLDQLFILARLIFVKRVEHYDAFEQAFASYFLGREAKGGAVSWEELFNEKPFRDWLRDQLETGLLTAEAVRAFDNEELLERFWQTVLAQQSRHQGGHTWVGTRGRSPWGHSGTEGGGIRVHGRSVHGTAQKVIGERRYVNYSGKTLLSSENLGQVLLSLKSLRPVGPETELDIDSTIARTAKNGGEIELVFERELRNRVRMVVLMDNGGYSMAPYIKLVKTVFNKIRDLFKDLSYYYFHNCIYGTVYVDAPRTRPLKWDKLTSLDRNTRVIIIGDANMAPAELWASHGALDIFTSVRKPGWEWLKELRETLPVSIWLNPLPKIQWSSESTTIQQIQKIFGMEDLTLAGIRNAVEYLNTRGKAYDPL